MTETKINSSLFTKFRKTQVNSVQKLPDITGLTLGEFHTDSRLDIVSGEADIYLCSGTGIHSGKKFLLKYYRRENAVKPEVLEKLKTVTSPFVASVACFGEYEGHQYVARPYYEMSALSELLAEGTLFSEEDLKTLIIPSIIEGLKAVHDAGILHKDLKPANLIPDDTGEHIVLIDFGISSDAGKNTFVVTQTGMTLAYASPEAMQGIFHKETDYYALGITVFELFTGFTPFQNPGLSPEEAARLASISKIEFPENFPEDLKKLVLGLTYKDISHRNEKDNPNRRWGYDEVRRWLNGEDVPVPGEGAVSGAASAAFQPYRFNGKTYTVETEFLRAMLAQPEEGLKDLGRGFLSHHYYAFSEKKGALCEYAEKKLGENKPGNNNLVHARILYALIYSLNPEVREICFNGKLRGSIQDLGRAFIDAGTKEALQNHGLRGKSYPLTSAVKEFMLSGIPEDYATTILKNTAVKDLFSKTSALWQNNEHTESDTELALILGYSLSSDRRLPIGGKLYASPEAFRKEMSALVGKDRSAYMKLMETARADLDFLEKNLPDPESREALSRARDESKLAVFGADEYYFKNGQEFQSYIEKLVQEEKPYEIRSLLNRYKTPLKQVSEKVWGTDALGSLQKTAAGFIQIGEYLFTGEPAFRDFIAGVLARGRKDPCYLLRFVKAHRASLESAAKAFPGIKETAASLYAASDAVIVFDEKVFRDKAEFQEFVNSTLSRSKREPRYLSGFMKRHKNTITDLEQKDELNVVLKPLKEAFQNLIHFDGRVFAAVSDFEACINSIITAGKADPGYLVAYAAKHKRELMDLEERDIRLKPAVKNFFKARNKLVSLDEYLFSTPEEFRLFAEDILKTGRSDPGFLRRFVSEHAKSLLQLSYAESLSATVKTLLDVGNSVIELDEYVFSDAADFAGFVGDIKEESRAKPLRGADFVRAHKAGLEALKSTELLVPAVKALQELAHAGEKGAAIMVNGTKYTSRLTKGEYIKFGNYPQNNDNTKEPIEWLVLEVSDQEALLVSRYGLDCKLYHHRDVPMTWEQCDLRKWLNNEFLEIAFSEEEQQRIRLSEVVNDDNPKYGTSGGNNTQDRVFCLSLAEAERYFKNNGERQCHPTAHARNQGVWVNSGNGCCYWWLRSPGFHQRYASDVGTDGALYPVGNLVYNAHYAVRPALRLIWDL